MEELKYRVELLNRLCGLAKGNFSKSDYLEAQILLTGLDETHRDKVIAYYKEHQWDNYYFVNRVLDMQLPEIDYSKKVDVNTPIAELLDNFQNRKSKKVVISRHELLRRYDHLDSTDQLTFRLALLKSPSVADNIQGCKYSMERWSGEELPLVELVWHNAYNEKNYDLWYWSGRLLLRHASTEFLLEYQYGLTHLRSEVVSALYYYLSLRLCKVPSFYLKKDNLRLGDYYRIIYHAGLAFNETEWLEDFFRAVAEIYIFSAHHSERRNVLSDYINPEVARKYTKADEFVPEAFHFRDAPRNKVSLAMIPTIRCLLLYGAVMGSEQISYVLNYLHKAEDLMIEEAKVCSGPDVYYWPRSWTKEQWLYVKSKVVIPCVEQLKTCCPKEFMYCFEESIKEYEEWLAPYVELAELGGYTDVEPVYRDGDSYGAVPPIKEFDWGTASGTFSSKLDRSPKFQQLKDTSWLGY